MPIRESNFRRGRKKVRNANAHPITASSTATDRITVVGSSWDTYGTRRVSVSNSQAGRAVPSAASIASDACACNFTLACDNILQVTFNVRAKRAATAGRQARAGENGRSTTGPGLVACRWRSA